MVKKCCLALIKQAISKARQGISYKAFVALFHLSTVLFYKHLSDINAWNKFHIFGVNGNNVSFQPGSHCKTKPYCE